MTEIIVGEKVINKTYGSGEITSFDERYIVIAFSNRNVKFLPNAFEQGFLKYVNPSLQEQANAEIRKIEEGVNQKNLEKENKRKLADKENETRMQMAKAFPLGVKFDYDAKITKRIDSVQVALSSVSSKHKALVQQIFTECDNDANQYFEEFHPAMTFPVPKGYYNRSYMGVASKAIPSFRSRYCVGFLTKYFDTYVFRVISRNDIFKLGIVGGSTVYASDTTEILRIIYIDGKTYCFSKHLSVENGRYKNTLLFNKWQASKYIDLINLDKIIRKCDCKYLNDYIETTKVNCFQYLNLLFPAFINNKIEILFKNHLFSETFYINDLETYVSEFSNKQIDFACKNNCINALPLVKKYSLNDLDVVKNIEYLMKQNKHSHSTYDLIRLLFMKHNFSLDVMDKKLINFLKHVENFNPLVYRDYIDNLFDYQEVNIEDIFAKNYLERHNIIMMEKHVGYSSSTARAYEQVANEFSWIDRKENGYYIMVPKTIEDFKIEGRAQHNCLFTNKYFLKVINRFSIIVFLRKEETKSYVTIEYEYGTFEVKQAYTKYNMDIDDDLYDYIVDLGKELAAEFSSLE